MADDAVYDAIHGFLTDPDNIIVLTQPGASAPPQIRFQNEDFTIPNPPTPWFSMALTGMLYEQESIGAAQQADNLWQEKGQLWLPVLVQKGTGASLALKLAKQMANLFRGLTLLNGDLEFLEAYRGQGTMSEDHANWFEVPLIINWRWMNA